MKKVLITLYTIGLMAFTVVAAVIIWNLTFAKFLKGYSQDKSSYQEASNINNPLDSLNKESTFSKMILESEERVKHYLGYRVLEEQRLEDHFHHIDFELKPDKSNYCIDCHGDTPHDKIKEIRAFGNMHASFLGCQTCHTRLEGDSRTGIFKWYDRSSGEIVPNPEMGETLPGRYECKIIPFEHADGNTRRIDTPERVDFAKKYEENEKNLTDTQKSSAKKIIHNIVDEKPYMCEDCHRKEVPLLPLEELGFTVKRINAVINSEVIGMIRKYTEFYMPSMLQPGIGKENQKEDFAESD